MKPEERQPDEILDEAIEDILSEKIDPVVVESAANRVWSNISGEIRQEEVASIRSCADFQALIPDYREGKLPEARALLVKDHVHECIACRKVLMGDSAKPAPVPRSKPAVATPFRWAIAAALALTVGLSSWYLFNQFGPAPDGPAATIAIADGPLYRITADEAAPVAPGTQLFAGEMIRTSKDSGAVVRLRDGSMVEVRERSDFSISETRKDVTIRLARGGVIVEAAKRGSGHLYVSTRDCRAAVTGTVFSVNGGMKGSRVSVIEGEVRVTQGGREQVLTAGGQYLSNSSLTPVAMEEEVSWSRNAAGHLAMLAEINALAEQMEQRVSLPELRYSSALLNYLPESTAIYIAVPNLGETLSEAHQVFEQRIQESATLRQWWEAKVANESGPTLEQVIDEVRRFSNYLGDEIVIAAMLNESGHPGEPVLLAELRQSGFAEFVRAESSALGGTPMKVFESQAAITAGTGKAPLMYVGPDAVAISSDAGVLSQLAASLETPPGPGGFTGTPFCEQIETAYSDGVGMLFSMDLERIAASGPKEMEVLGNPRHMLAGQKQSNGKLDTRAVITFNGPRQGLASWLANPAPIGALDFVSPDALMVSAFAANDLTGVLDEVFAKLPEFRKELAKAETEVGISVRDDLAAAFGAEFAIALDGPVLPVPSWKLVAQVYQPGRLQSTIQALAAAVNRAAAEHGKPGIQIAEETAGGRTYHSLIIESVKPFGEVHYVIVDGYLVAAPSRALLDQAIDNRAAGSVLPTSALFTSLLPRDHHENFSAMAYHNIGPAIAPLTGLLSEEQRQAVEGLSDIMEPTLVLVYGEEDNITLATTSEVIGFTPANLFGLRMPLGIQSAMGSLKPRGSGQ